MYRKFSRDSKMCSFLSKYLGEKEGQPWLDNKQIILIRAWKVVVLTLLGRAGEWLLHLAPSVIWQLRLIVQLSTIIAKSNCPPASTLARTVQNIKQFEGKIYSTETKIQRYFSFISYLLGWCLLMCFSRPPFEMLRRPHKLQENLGGFFPRLMLAKVSFVNWSK